MQQISTAAVLTKFPSSSALSSSLWWSSNESCIVAPVGELFPLLIRFGGRVLWMLADLCRYGTCSVSGGRSKELRVSRDSIRLCRGLWPKESVLLRETLSPSNILPLPLPPPAPSSSELEWPSPESKERRSPDCCFCLFKLGARPRLFQLERRLFQLLLELQGACGELRTLDCKVNGRRNFHNIVR